MRDGLGVFDGSTFFASDVAGDLVGGEHGFFYADTRHLSRWELLVDGRPSRVSTSRTIDYYSARIAGTVATAGTDGDAPTLTVQRDRIVADGVHEDIAIENHDARSRRVSVELRFAADFADLFEVRRGASRRRSVQVDVAADHVTAAYDHEGFRRGTMLTFTETGAMSDGAVRFDIEIGPHER